MRLTRLGAVWTIVSLLLLMHGRAFSAQLSKSIKKRMKEVTLGQLGTAPGSYFNKGIKVAIPYNGKNSYVDYQIRQYWLGRGKYFHIELFDNDLERTCPFVIEIKKFPWLMKKILTLEMGSRVLCYGKIIDNKRKNVAWRRYGFYVMDIDPMDGGEKGGRSERAFDPGEYEEVSAKKLNLMRAKYVNKKVRLNLVYWGLDNQLSYYLTQPLKITTESHCQLRAYGIAGSSNELGDILVLVNKSNDENVEVLLDAKEGSVLAMYGELRRVKYSHRPKYHIRVDRIHATAEGMDEPKEKEQVFNPDDYKSVTVKELTLLRSKLADSNIKFSIAYPGMDPDIYPYVREHANITTETHVQLKRYNAEAGSADLRDIIVVIDKDDEWNVEVLIDVNEGDNVNLYGRLKRCEYSNMPKYYIIVRRIELQNGSD